VRNPEKGRCLGEANPGQVFVGSEELGEIAEPEHSISLKGT
jgi:hypothetical protein